MNLLKQRIREITVASVWRRTVFTVSDIIIFIFCFDVAFKLADRKLETFVVAIALYYLFFYSNVVIHELGHAFAAWVVGWRVHFIAIGSRGFAPVQRKFFRLQVNNRFSDIKGWVLATPQNGLDWSSGNVPFLLGGPVANLLAGAGAIGSGLFLVSPSDVILSVASLSFGKASIVVGISNLIPTTGHMKSKSDGAQLLSILRGISPSTTDRDISRLYGWYYDGVPAEQWDGKIVTKLIDIAPDEQIAVDPFLISYFLELGKLNPAQQILERHMRAVPDLPADYSCVYAFCIAMLNRDVAKAEKILKELPKKDAKRSFCYWRARAVCSYLRKNNREASDAIDRARKIVRKAKIELDKDDEAIFAAILKERDLPILN